MSHSHSPSLRSPLETPAIRASTAPGFERAPSSRRAASPSRAGPRPETGPLPSFRDRFEAALEAVDHGERRVARSVRRISRGADLEPGRLVALQAEIHRHTLRLELAGRFVDQATSAVRRVIESQR